MITVPQSHASYLAGDEGAPHVSVAVLALPYAADMQACLLAAAGMVW